MSVLDSVNDFIGFSYSMVLSEVFNCILNVHCYQALIPLFLFGRIHQESSWMAVWDAALEFGRKGTNHSQALLHALTQPVYGDQRCPLENCDRYACSWQYQLRLGSFDRWGRFWIYCDVGCVVSAELSFEMKLLCILDLGCDQILEVGHCMSASAAYATKLVVGTWSPK